MLVLPVNNAHFVKGMNYAIKSWHSTFNRMGKGPYQRIRNILKGVTAEYVFIDYIEHNNISHDLSGKTRWYEIDRYDIGVNGKKVDIKANFLDLDTNYLIQRDIRQLNLTNSEWLLDCCALVPSDQLRSSTLPDDGYYVFAYITGSFNPLNHSDRYYLHAFWEYEWLKPNRWIREHGTQKLGKIFIRSYEKNDKNKNFKIIGTVYRKNLHIETLRLDNNCEAESKEDFFQIFTLIPENGIPEGVIILEGENTNLIEEINPKIGFSAYRDNDNNMIINQNDWENIMLYDSYVYFAGCMMKKAFKKKSKVIPRFYKECKQYQDTLIANNKILVRELNNITMLL